MTNTIPAWINQFHLVQESPWPLISSLGAFNLTTGAVLWFFNSASTFITLGLSSIIVIIIIWWRDVNRESTHQGQHSNNTIEGLQIGVILFIASEVSFFFSFFWSFFHSSLAPNIDTGTVWPPSGVLSLLPWGVPLLNTVVLLASGITVTWAHYCILSNTSDQATQALALTIIIGAYFTILQTIEYIETPFSISDGAYGTTFFVATGFHGLHVIIGTTFLIVSINRQSNLYLTQNHHIGFEAAAWYWHFVDVVWLFLFMSIYWWGC